MKEPMQTQIIFSELRKFQAAHFCVYASFNAVLVGDCKQYGSYLIFDARISTDDWAESHVDLNGRLSVQTPNVNESSNLRRAVVEADEWYEICQRRFEIAQRTYDAEQAAR